MVYLFILLFILQFISFYLIITKIRPVVVKEEGIVLKALPKVTGVKDVGFLNEFISDILESVSLEGWDIVIVPSNYPYITAFNINIKSKYGLSINCLISVVNKMPYLRDFKILGDGEKISLSGGDDYITNKIILYMWDLIIKDQEYKNVLLYKEYESSMKVIQGRLKVISRDKRFKDLGI